MDCALQRNYVRRKNSFNHDVGKLARKIKLCAWWTTQEETIVGLNIKTCSKQRVLKI